MKLGAGVMLAVLSVAVSARDHSDTQPVWSAVTGGAFPGPPVIGPDGRVFAASDDRYLHAYARDGDALWRYDLRRDAAGPMCATDDGLVLVERDDGVLVAVNPAGKAVWNRSGGSARPGILCAPSGLIYRFEGEREMAALSPRGSRLWRVELGGSPVSDPVLAAGRIIVGLGNGDVEFYGRSGTRLGAVTLPVEPTVLSAASAGGVLAGGADGSVFELDNTEVVRSWHPGVAAVRAVLPAGGTDRGAAGYVGLANGAVYRLDREPAWRRLHVPEDRAAVHARGGQRAAGDGAAGEGAAGADGGRAGGARLLAVVAGAEAVLILSADGAVYESGVDGLRSVTPPSVRIGGAGGPAFGTVDAGGRAVVVGPSWTVAAWDVPHPVRGGVRPGGAGATNDSATEIDRIYLTRLLGSPALREQQRALSEIEQRATVGDLAGSYEHTVAALLEFATGARGGDTGRGAPGGGAGGLEERLRAVRLLGRIGGYGVRDALLGMARDGEERELRIAVLEALGELPADGQGRTARAILRVTREEARRGASARLGRAALEALRGYVSYRGGIDDAALAETLGILASGGFPRAVVEDVRALAGELY